MYRSMNDILDHWTVISTFSLFISWIPNIQYTRVFWYMVGRLFHGINRFMYKLVQKPMVITRNHCFWGHEEWCFIISQVQIHDLVDAKEFFWKTKGIREIERKAVEPDNSHLSNFTSHESELIFVGKTRSTQTRYCFPWESP